MGTYDVYPQQTQATADPVGPTQVDYPPVLVSQPTYPPMAYPGPVYGRPEHPDATAVLILGTLSLVVLPFLGIVAWVMGNKAVKECDAGQYTSTTTLRVGRILGIIGTALLGVIVVVGIIAVLGVVAMAVRGV